jgi:ketosteroid isomerase-like protein
VTETTAERMFEPLGRACDTLERSDVEGFMAIIEEISHPNCEWTSHFSGEVEGRTHRGYDGMRTWASDLSEAFDVRYEDREFRAIGDDVVLFLCRFEYRGRGSGIDLSNELGVLYEFEEGQFRQGRAYGSHAEALAAAEAIRVRAGS